LATLLIPSLCLLSENDAAFAAEQPVKIRVLSSWSTDYLYVKEWLVPYVQRLNQRGGGRLQVAWVGPEAVPPFEQLKPLSAGLFDMLYTHSAYHMGEIAAAVGLDLVSALPRDRRSSGFYELLDEAYRKVNAKVLGLSFGAVGYHFVLKKELNKADFTGLKLRTSPFYDPLVNGLGGSTVRVAPGEIYSALEKGVVDGAAWPVLGALDYKWYEVAKLQLRPQFGEVIELVLFNSDAWNKIPKDLQGLIVQVTKEMEEDGYKALTAKVIEEEKKLVSLGMKLNVLPPAEGDKLLKTYYDRTWEGIVLKHSPDFGPKMKKIADELMKKNK
jgi:TRAP-type mannitol/chloroaromatic compound transport system substrate-binding protein